MDGDRTTRLADAGSPDRAGAADASTTADPLLLAGRYRLGELLGRGGVADVHRAVDELLGREVAVKLVRSDTADPAARERFAAEMRTHAGLSHPNLVTVLDAGTAGARPFLVMELVRGRTLADTATSPSTPREVARLGAAVASGLAHVHSRGVVHRDLKPANVLLGDDGRVALSDFGVARLVEVDHGHTATGFTVGTAAYFAPEQVTGSDVTPAADVYSLGLVLLEALTGRRAYPGPPTQAALARLQHGPVVPDGLPPVLTDLLRRMTATDPAARPSAAEVEDVLRRAVSARAPRPVHAAPVDATRPMPRPDLTAPAAAPAAAAAPAPDAPAAAAPAPAATAVRTSVHPPPRAPGDPPPGVQAARRRPSPVMLAVLVVLAVIAVVLVAGLVDASRQDVAPGGDEVQVLLEELDRAVNG